MAITALISLTPLSSSTNHPSPPRPRPTTLSATLSGRPIRSRRPRLRRTCAAPPETVDAATATATATAQELASSGGDEGGALIISGLFFVAFVALSVLTVGVVYLGVKDFLEKREREKFEKEEAAKNEKNEKKGGNKKRKLAGSRPRGFGQKIEYDYEDDD